jgi:hypothetical protein
MAEESYISNPNVGFAKVANYLKIPHQNGKCIIDDKSIDGYGQCYFFKRNLYRTGMQDCLPDPALVFNSKSYRGKNFHIKGFLSYMGIFPERFEYDVYEDSDAIKISTKINFRYEESTGNDDNTYTVKLIKENLEEKSNSIWSKLDQNSLILLSLKLDVPGSYFQPKLKYNTRGPYYMAWPLENDQVDDYDRAHELGHIFGLDDEYNNLKATFTSSSGSECSKHSLMCNTSDIGRVLDWHYYAILSRAFCNKK